MHGWKEVHGKSVFDTYSDLDNPLPSLIQKMKVCYKSGGFFNIRRVKWDKDGQMFLDYSILIASIEDPEQFKFLE